MNTASGIPLNTRAIYANTPYIYNILTHECTVCTQQLFTSSFNQQNILKYSTSQNKESSIITLLIY